MRDHQPRDKSIPTFTDQSLAVIQSWLNQKFQHRSSVTFRVLNPDRSTYHFSGETICIADQSYRYRGYKVWVNLAELMKCRMLTPHKVDETLIELTLVRLNLDASFHTAKVEEKQEKYGTDSLFFHIDKNEEPTFLHAYSQALQSVKIAERQTVLNLGINKADEFQRIEEMVEPKIFEQMQLIGIDHSASAITYAQNHFPTQHFYQYDINRLEELNLPLCDLIISIGTLQSPGINYKPFLMSLVQNHLSENGALILGFPNSRWIDHELIYGAKAPNYNYSEMSLLFNDVIFAKKYLQQKKFRVTVTGREYIFLTATKIGLK